MSNYNDDPLRWTVQTKVDKDTHDAIQEIANSTAPNISQWLRDAIGYMIENQFNHASPSTRLKWLKKKRIERNEAKALLLSEYSEYLSEPNLESEKLLRETAKELGIDWPPEYTLFDIPEYRKIMNYLDEIGGYATSRSLQRKMNMTKSELDRKLERLESEELIVIEESGKSTVVYLVEYKNIKDQIEE